MAGKRRSLRGAMRGVGLLGIVMMSMVLSVRADEGGGKSKLAVIEYDAPNLYPEGFDWDAKHSRFLVGSMGQGKLVTVTEQGVVQDFVKDEAYAGGFTLGVTVDLIYNRVLAVVHRVSPALNALVAYDLDSKKRTLYVNLTKGGAPGNDVANDVAVDGEGNAYVTNSAANFVWKVTYQGHKTVLVANIPQKPVVVEAELGKDVTSNGIVYHDGYLLVCQSNSGALLRVSLADNQVQTVKVKDEVLMPVADGMALRSDGSLVVVSSHTAWLLSTRDSWRSATVIDKVPLDATGFTTSAAINDLRTFTLHSHLPESIKGVDRDSFTIVEIEFPSDSDNNPLWLLAIVGMFAVLVLVWKFQLNQFNKQFTKKRI